MYQPIRTANAKTRHGPRDAQRLLRALCACLLPCAGLGWSLPALAAEQPDSVLGQAVRRAVAERVDAAVAAEVESLFADSLRDPRRVAAVSGDAAGGFNMAFLHGVDSAMDLQALLGASGVVEGTQRVDVYVNQARVGRYDIAFSQEPRSGEAEACFSATLLAQLGVDAARLPALPDPEAACLRLADVVPQASVRYDTTQLRLEIGVPQLYLAPARRGQVDPSLWDRGVNAAFLDYSLNGRQDQVRGLGTTRDLNVGLRMGLNLGAWRLRNDSYLTTGNRRDTEFSSQNTYLQRELVPLRSQLVLGQTYTYSPLFDSVRFLGVRLASDEGMRPDDEQGYAPVVRGTAETNATLEIRQNGYLIHSSSVAPGPFEIRDLAPSGANGDLEITVIEADGSRRVSRQAFSAPPLMVRQGRIKYDAAAGQVRLHDHQRNAPAFANASLLYGVGANTTLAAGLQAADDFQAYSLGVGLNTRLGALSLNGLHSSSRVDGRRIGGERVELRYAGFLERTGTRVSLNWLRDLDPGYRTLGGHALERERGIAFPLAEQATRQRLDAYLTQSIGEASLYLSGSLGRNWDGSASRSVSLGHSNRIGRGTYTASYTHSRNLFSYGGAATTRDNALMLSVSLPLGRQPRAPQAYASAGRQGGGNSVQAGVTGTLPLADQEISYAASAGRDALGQNSGSLSLGAVTPVARVSAAYSHGGRTDSLSVSASGSVVAHAGGVNLGQSLSETFMLARVEPSVAGVGVSSFTGVRTGRNGYAVIPSATPYRSNWVGLDTAGADRDVDVDTAMQQQVPTRGAVVLARFKADAGRRVQFELQQPDGAPMPFGASVEGADGEHLGITDPRGRLLVMLPVAQVQGRLRVQWDGYSCSATYAVPERGVAENYQRLPLRCDAGGAAGAAPGQP
ncbi:fimbria/pilus outer membrane usher protein [Stenotrophomonas mori]|uniref:Fimbrial biogenesis outer membrane usher protein n=1 Tax=Stenotrophomonas mori TaxID=2871096 RepID=A0ABT0SKR2_9GAMM|nr:fimbria/pilus outer membrane usher protein [Stenotrophomonas mori]MCL7715565.1 fimbrial biogenesis outer membrane usher protein [Stenotrophomonas mori]